MLAAGSLNRQITIQRPGSGRDAAGQPVPGGWEDVATVWSDVRQQSGLGAIKADAPVSKSAASMRIRYRTDLEERMRVQYDGRTYKIAAIIKDPRRVFIDLVCEVTS